jgi:inorganic pyrophosphatase
MLMKDVLSHESWAPRPADYGRFHVIIETPQGSRNKYRYDEELRLFKLEDVLPRGAAFPFDVGFIPSTRGEDGCPLDVLVLMDEPAFTGCVVPAHLIGVLEAELTEHGPAVRHDRLVAVPDTGVHPPEVRSLDELGRALLDEIDHFFVSYHQRDGREFRLLGHLGPVRAAQLVEAGARRCRHGGVDAKAFASA